MVDVVVIRAGGIRVETEVEAREEMAVEAEVVMAGVNCKRVHANADAPSRVHCVRFVL